MGRLIDADSLIGCAIIRPTSLEDIEHINACKERISHNDTPTAYDVNKVVAELKIHTCKLSYKDSKFGAMVIDIPMVKIDSAEEIVRKGGVNESKT